MTARQFKEIILASTSATRLAMLEAAGLALRVVAPEVDERPVKVKLAATRARAETLATTLAELKAVAVSKQFPEALVIGADQVLDCDGKLFDKPVGRDGAKRQLKDLRGKRHRLLSAVAVATGGEVAWKHVAAASLSMRVFSDAFLDSYLERAGDDVLGSVGAYRIEGLGAQLFAKVDGDQSTILGLPLLPLLDHLRLAGAIGS
jgi:septum formation protein